MQTSFPYHLSSQGVPYLGIMITPCTSQLASRKFDTLHEKLTKELTHLANFELSWSGCLASYKMLILPWIFYPFRTLVVTFSAKQLLILKNQLKCFIWQGKRAICSHSLLLKHRLAGGMELVDVKDYYLATRLDQIQHWFKLIDPLPLVEIEKTLARDPDLHALLMADLWQPRPLQSVSPPMTPCSWLGESCMPLLTRNPMTPKYIIQLQP